MYALSAASPSLEASRRSARSSFRRMWNSMRASGSIATAAARGRRSAGHLISGWAERVPGGAKRSHALAVCVAGLLVAGVQVERVAVVGDLWCSVGTFGGRGHRGVRAVADGRHAVRPDGGPVDGAPTATGALAAVVLLEQVDRPALRIDEHVAQAGFRDLDRRRLSARRLGRRLSGGCVAAAATGERDRGQGYRGGGEEGNRLAVSHVRSFVLGGRGAAIAAEQRWPHRPSETAPASIAG